MGAALKRLKAEGLWGFKEVVYKGERSAPAERKWSQMPLSLVPSKIFSHILL